MFGLLLLVAVACGPAPVPPSVPGATVSTLPASLLGLSGLTLDDAGGLWAVAERDARLVPLRLDGDRVVEAGAPIALEGWPPDTDAESIAWIAPGRFALGAEPRELEARDTDAIFEVRVEGGEARVTGTHTVAYSPFDLRAEANRGLEGLGATPTVTVAAAETVVATPEGRFAPLWRIGRDGTVGTARLRLTSDTGKISDLAAWDQGEATRLLAIERHYAVSRLVAAEVTWGTAEAPSTAVASLVWDLAPLLDPMPNLEGLVLLPDGRIVLLADNQSAGSAGPAIAVVLGPER